MTSKLNPMKKVYSILLALFVTLLLVPSIAQGQLTLSIDNECPTIGGEQVCLGLSIDNFTDLVDVQFTINNSPANLTFDNFQALNLTGLTLDNFEIPYNGAINFSWSDVTQTGVTVPDGTTIFEMCFTPENDNEFTSVHVSLFAPSLSATDVNSNDVPIEVVNGGVGCKFDLALRNTLESGNLFPDGYATFRIEVFNQGKEEAASVEITNYIPAGLELNDANWTQNGTLAARDIGNIAAGDTATVFITFTIPQDFQCPEFINYAEISEFSNSFANPLPIPDVDSTPDQDNTNDAGGQPNTQADNYVNGFGTGMPGEGVANSDEDDHDGELVAMSGTTSTLELSVNNTLYQANCEGALVILVAEATGGSGDYSYQWSHGIGEGATQEIQVNENTTYFITVTDNDSGCMKTVQHLVGVDGPLQVICLPTSTSCFGGADGCAEVIITGGVPPYQFIWPDGQSGNPICNLAAGVYTVTVVDGLGCQALCETIIENGAPLEITVIADPFVICQGEEALLSAEVQGGTGAYIYQWIPSIELSSPVDQFTLASPPSTTMYEVFVTDANGCWGSASTLLEVIEAPDVSPAFSQQVCVDSPPFELSLDQPNGIFSGVGVINNIFDPAVAGLGTHIIAYEYLFGDDCNFEGEFTIEVIDDECLSIHGKVVMDNGDCIAEVSEMGLSNWLVKISSDDHLYFTVTNSEGFYSLQVVPDIYEVSVILPNQWTWDNCADAYEANLVDNLDVELDIPVIELEPCPHMTVNIGTSGLLRCSSNYYWVEYCNLGSALAEGAQITIELDPFLTYLSSEIPLAAQDGNLLTFELGDVDINECADFWIAVHVNCDAVLGQTHCTEAYIFPNELCQPDDDLWSGASLSLGAMCEGDSVRFIITNDGTADMLTSQVFIVVEDGVMLSAMPNEVDLNAGEEFTIAFEADGSTRRLEIPQVPFHPGESMPNISVEGCGVNEDGEISTGFVTQFDTDDYDDFSDIDCTENIGAFDPNDKSAIPKGFGPEHYLYPNTDIEYMIRFQNTGTAPAQLVVIRDTLSPWLDITTIRPGVSSHDYSFGIDSSNVLVFSFENIMLPDSNANEAASHGFIKYRIDQIKDVPLLTKINNSAAIYFDYNEPVITNTVQHIINVDFLDMVDGLDQEPHYIVDVFPNPVSTSFVIVTDENTSRQKNVLLFDPLGRLILEETFIDFQKSVNTKNLPEGLYFYQLEVAGKVTGRGKIIIER
jgi:uncharacterized repeat protein (TIGR01451 family)